MALGNGGPRGGVTCCVAAVIMDRAWLVVRPVSPTYPRVVCVRNGTSESSSDRSVAADRFVSSRAKRVCLKVLQTPAMTRILTLITCPLTYSLAVVALLLCDGAQLSGADWPTFRHDPARTASTPERLPTDLTRHWTRQLPPPRPAWPAEQGKVRFDSSYEPVAAGGRLFVPSMVHDCVTAYDLATGAALAVLC